MAVTFLLKDKNSKNETLIFANYSYEGNSLKISTGIKVLPRYWNQNKCRVKEIQTYSKAKQINLILNKWKSKIETTYLELKLKGMPRHPEALKACIKGQTKLNHTLTSYFEWYQANEIERGGFQLAQAYKEQLAEERKLFLEVTERFTDAIGKLGAIKK